MSAFRKQDREVSAAGEERPLRSIPQSSLLRPENALEAAFSASPETLSPRRAKTAREARAVTGTGLVVFTDTVLPIPFIDRNSQAPEPSLAINEPVIFTTGNRYASLSTDGGKSFTFIDPAAAFPPPTSGFCCAQVALHVPSRDLLVWLLQYASGPTGNILRLAVSRGQTSQSSQVWTYFDLAPQTVGANFPAGFVFETSELAYSDNSLYLTTNAFSSSSTSATFVASLILRFSLDELAVANFAHWDAFPLTDVAKLKPVQDAASTMYFLSHPAKSAVRVLSLPETEDVLSYVDVAVTPYVDGSGKDSFCPDPNGVNACGGSDDRISAAWRSAASGQIGAMWNAAQGGVYPLPYTQVAVLRESDGALLDEAFIWSQDLAWQYPSVAVNSRGDIAGTISYAGASAFVGTALWISDDVNGHSLSPLEVEIAVAGNRSPTGNRWGDFFTTRRSRLTDLWETVAVADTQQANGAELHFMSFGRERDGPVPSSPIANFAFSPGNPVAGQRVAFTDLSLGGPTSWSWSFADGGSSTVENAVHTYPTGSTYDVTLTVDNAQGSSSVTKPVTVLPAGLRAPSIAFTLTGASRDPVFDAFDALIGQPITFTASETAATQYVWDFGDGTSGSGQTVVKTYTTAGPMLGHLSVYGDGVHSQVGPLIGNFRINVQLPGLPLPSAGYTISGAALDPGTGSYDSAVGKEMTFSAVEANAGQYLWYFGDGTAGSGRVVTKTFSRAGLWTVKLVVYGDGSVTATGPTVVAIPVNITVCKRCPRTVPFR